MRQRGRECRYAAERRVLGIPGESACSLPYQSPMGGRMSKSRAVSLGFVAALAAAAILGGVMSGGASAISRASTITPAPAFTAAQLAATPSTDWLTTGGGLTSQRYSSLNQITAANASGLKQAWKTNLDGSGKAAKYSQEATPIVHNGVMYIPRGTTTSSPSTPRRARTSGSTSRRSPRTTTRSAAAGTPAGSASAKGSCSPSSSTAGS